ncbi:large ribosomal subunit protein uL2-like [Miscanthus floridulus]|uniref:large ribosomal subunit protein uL2-like n=1 Tax=Miscanthus floridulus TaxID=154761 RepID=UPI0034590675
MLSIGNARGMYMGQFVYYGRRVTLSIGNAWGMCMGQFNYCGHRATLSIGDVLPLRGVLEGTVTCNVELHVGNCSASSRATEDYAIIVSRNPDSDASTGASRDYAIIISRNPDNGVRAGNASHQRRDTANDDKVDDVRHPPALLPLRQHRLLSKGGSHHLIYVG